MTNRRLGNITAFLGNIFEHLETAAFTFTGTLIVGYFFPPETGSFWAKYGIGIAISGSFWLQPFGAMIFAWVGDTFGRKPALNMSYVTAIVPTLFIVLVPDYATIGIWSSILLILCRVAQGLGSGGAFGGRIVYVLESNQEGARYLNSGILASTGFIGALLATSLSAYFMQGEGAYEGWKAPYIFAVCLGLVLLFLKRYFSETPAFLKAKKEKTKSFKTLVKTYPREMTFVLLMGMSSLVPFYLGLSWMGGYFKEIMGLTNSQILFQSSLVMLLTAFTCFLSFLTVVRKINKSNNLLISVVLSLFITGFFYMGLKESNLLYLQIGLYILPVYMGFIVPIMLMLIVDLFPTKERYRGYAIPLSIGQALMVGTTPLLAEIAFNITGQYQMVALVSASSTFLLAICYILSLNEKNRGLL
jgi:MHS family proline/betaine transporter-like MFS transporter